MPDTMGCSPAKCLLSARVLSARRFGFFELARETNAIDAVKADLERFDAMVAENPDLNRLVRSPVFSAAEQLQAMSAVLDRAGIGGLAAKFLKLVTMNRRLFAARDMVRGYRELVALHKGEATACLERSS